MTGADGQHPPLAGSPPDLEQVRTRLIAYLESQLESPPEAAIAPESELIRDLRLDSIQAFEMVADLEDDYGISIPPDEAQSLVTVDDVARLVHRRLGARES